MQETTLVVTVAAQEGAFPDRFPDILADYLGDTIDKIIGERSDVTRWRYTISGLTTLTAAEEYRHPQPPWNPLAEPT